MKLSHNKKRNTIFIYEMLVKQLSKASMYNIVEKKQQILSILKEESERISRETIPTWGWTTHDLFEIIDNIETRLEDYTDVEHG